MPLLIDLIDFRGGDQEKPTWFTWSLLDLIILSTLMLSIIAICKIGTIRGLQMPWAY